jgi:hypothetical protein
MATIVDDNCFVCADCLIWVANGDASGMDEKTHAHVTNTANDVRGYWCAGDSDKEKDFSWSACDRCGCALGGSRHHAVILGD